MSTTAGHRPLKGSRNEATIYIVEGHTSQQSWYESFKSYFQVVCTRCARLEKVEEKGTSREGAESKDFVSVFQGFFFSPPSFTMNS
jgi:hypothetical protein